MKVSNPIVSLVAAVLVLTAFPAAAQDAPPDSKEELQALVQATTRLVESLERSETARLADRNLLQVQVAVQLLDIRVKQQETLQRALRSIDDREQRLNGYIAASEVKLENMKKQISDALDEQQKLELQAKYDERMVYLTNQTNELDYLAQRRATLQSRLMDGERSVLDIEELVQGWVAEVQNPSPKR